MSLLTSFKFKKETSRTMRMRKIEAPMTLDELKKKIRSGKIKIVGPKMASENVLAGEAFGTRENPKFSSVEFGGVFSWAGSVSVDMAGKEYPSPSQMGFRFNWVAPGVGFGEFSFSLLADGKLEIDTERLGKEFFKKALCHMIDSAKDKSQKTN